MPIIRRVSGYDYDVFISYSGRGSAPKWLLNNFHPKLQDCLIDQIAPAPRIFIDKRMARGVEWSEELKRALRHSKILLAVLSPPYFESPWCMAELHTMHEREKVLGLAGPDNPQGLIYPILYSDSENFPDEEGLLRRSWWDFKEFSTPELVFQESRDWPLFHRRVTEFAKDLVALLKQVPEWQPDWPVAKEPDPVLLPPPPIPRFHP